LLGARESSQQPTTSNQQPAPSNQPQQPDPLERTRAVHSNDEGSCSRIRCRACCRSGGPPCHAPVGGARGNRRARPHARGEPRCKASRRTGDNAGGHRIHFLAGAWCAGRASARSGGEARHRGLYAGAQGARSEAVTYLQRELDKYRHTSLVKRIQKNINLLSLEGVAAPALDLSETIGRRPEVDATKGKVVVLFFWAHWCPDCKNQGPILAKLLEKYRTDGLTIIAPTQRFGYVAGGRPASPDDELRYIVEIRDQYYGFLADKLVPVSVLNHERYGVSTTPTLVILDRKGLVRQYHPGQMTEAELEAQIRPLL
jgi:thiol-disulfide isomerase/thioredoxin